MPENTKKNKKVGAGWFHNKEGVEYISCTVEIEGRKVSFSLFRNTYKVHPAQPDYNILLSGNGQS